MVKITEEQKKEQDQFWPKFTIRCDECKSFNVWLHNDRGWSETSGEWGGLHLVCKDCKTRTTLSGF